MRDYKKYEPFFGSWYLGKKLGEGSFGAVYEINKKGEDSIGVPSALKIISIPVSDDEVRSMLDSKGSEKTRSYYTSVKNSLMEEIKIMYDLRGNTNIVSIEDYHVYSHDDGYGYDIVIKMELLTPIDKRSSNLSMKDVIRIGQDMCKALSICHKKNIIHRDIKPSNIFISNSGDYKLGDFGIARHMDSASTQLSKKGTVDFMAPEVYQGNMAYDKTVDIYSLGIVLYYLLNGNMIPFGPDRDVEYTFDLHQKALAKRFKGEELPWLDYIPDVFNKLLRKACKFDPEKRYENCDQMLHDLLRLESQGTEVLSLGDMTRRITELKQKQEEERRQAELERIKREKRKKEEENKRKRKKRISGIIAASAVCCVAIICGAVYFLTQSGGEDVILNSTAIHYDMSDGEYENAVIIEVENGKKNNTLTSLSVKSKQGVEFTVYGCVPAGETGLMAGVYRSSDKPEDNFEIDITDDSFDENAPKDFTQISAEINGGGNNITMETGHGEDGYATDWDDDGFAEYVIDINNKNELSLSENESIGVAVVYAENDIENGDIFYNSLGNIGADGNTADIAVLPKELAEDDKVEIFILPKYEVKK